MKLKSEDLPSTLKKCKSYHEGLLQYSGVYMNPTGKTLEEITVALLEELEKRIQNETNLS